MDVPTTKSLPEDMLQLYEIGEKRQAELSDSARLARLGVGVNSRALPTQKARRQISHPPDRA